MLDLATLTDEALAERARLASTPGMVAAMAERYVTDGGALADIIDAAYGAHHG